MKFWGKAFLLISGILMIFVGIYALCHPLSTLLSMAIMLGIFMLIAGISDIVAYCNMRNTELSSSWLLFDGILTVLVSLLFLGNNYMVASVFPFLFSVWFLFSGVEKIIHAYDFKQLGGDKWWILLIFGILFALVGLLSLFRPMVGILAISVFLGIGFIIRGISTLSLWLLAKDI